MAIVFNRRKANMLQKQGCSTTQEQHIQVQHNFPAFLPNIQSVILTTFDLIINLENLHRLHIRHNGQIYRLTVSTQGKNAASS